MNDERNDRAVMVKSLFERGPRVPAIGTDRVEEGFDGDGICGCRPVLVEEAIVPGRNRKLSFNDHHWRNKQKSKKQSRRCYRTRLLWDCHFFFPFVVLWFRFVYF